MKICIGITLVAVLFMSDYAFSQTCPCDTLELSDGTTDNDIVELLCPGGELAEDALFEINQFSVVVGSESAFYQALNEPDLGSGCSIAAIGAGADGMELSPEETEICRQSLIQRCDLKRITPIPTLGEWGMIAMAGVLGVIGLVVAARRGKAAA